MKLFLRPDADIYSIYIYIYIYMCVVFTYHPTHLSDTFAFVFDVFVQQIRFHTFERI